MSDPQPAPKPDVGAALRKKRQNRGLSLETVYQHTRIPKRLLEALENNDAAAFAAPVYQRGFLKNYCDYLELDFEPLWRELSGSGSPPPDAPRTPRPAKQPDGQADRAPVALPLPDPVMLPFAIIAVLLIAGAVLWSLRGKETRPVAATPPPPAAVAPVNPVPEMSLKVVPMRETWIRLSADGVLRFEGRMPLGVPQEWRAKKGFSLRVSEPADLSVLIDGATTQLRGYPKDTEGGYLISR
ncbi:MAG TPA: hypothetical protein DCM05_14935 [Elusimicrobia bacterium]|nr:hypothetical protein [Elusimicrobiota bacterium]